MKKVAIILIVLSSIFTFSRSVSAGSLSNGVAGRILLQVESEGEAWYVYPHDSKRYYLGRPANALDLMRRLGLGINEDVYNSYNGYAPRGLSGRILLRVKSHGEAYYVNPSDLRLYYLGRPADAFAIMRKFGLGITNNNLTKIPIADSSMSPGSTSVSLPTNFTRFEKCRNEACLSQNFDYLIVTRPMFEATLEDFIKWRQEQGTSIGLVTVDWIVQNFSGKFSPDKIKNAIIGFHDKGTKYVLLVGDTQINMLWNEAKSVQATVAKLVKDYNFDSPWNVPMGYFSEALVSGSINNPIIDYWAGPTDLFYADKRNWDSDGTGVNDFKKIQGQIGLDIFLGRWPVRKIEELVSIIDKTKNTPKAKEMMVLADFPRTCAGIPADDRASNCFPHNFFGVIPLDIKTKYYSNTNKKINTAEQVQQDKDALPANIEYVPYDSEKDRIKVLAGFSEAKGIVSELAHGTHGCIYPADGFCQSSFNFKEKFPLFETVSCLVSTFSQYEDDSFSEALLKYKNGPAVVVQPQDNEVFYAGIFAGKTVGEAFYERIRLNKIQTTSNILLGDPALVVYSK